MTTGAARREDARTASPKQAFETRIERRHPACAAIPSQNRSPLAQKSAAKTNGGERNRFPEQTRSAKRPARSNPCISIVFLEPRKTGACGAEARMHSLGTLTRGTQRILDTSPLRCGLSHKENRPGASESPRRTVTGADGAQREKNPKRNRAKPPRRQRRPGADGARRSKGTPTRSQAKQPQAGGESPGRKPRTGKGTRNAAYENRRMLKGGGSPTHGNRQSAPWREEDAQGALAFRIGYLSLGASFTSCPRLATTGMVMALAGQASTQALQRVQSASVRSP